MKSTFVLFPLLLMSLSSHAVEPDRVFTYKQVGEVGLDLRVFHPEAHDPSVPLPGIVFFFGGGWIKSNPEQFHRQARHLASRGMVAICADYRTEQSHQAAPAESLQDARSALRWVRAHAGELGIDPKRLAAGGGSAGGHLAAAAALAEGFDEEGEDTSVSCRPDALVLFNPVVDNGPGGYGHDRVEAYWREFSPLHNIRAGAPPTLILLGTADELIPVATAQEFEKRMLEVGSRCEVVLYDGQRHGFFNQARFAETLLDMDRFLVSLGYLDPVLPDDGDAPFSQGELLYNNDLASEADLQGWRMEGPGSLHFADGWLEMWSPDQENHHVLWCPEDFPASFVAEWEAQNLNPEWGLCIVFFAALGVQGEDIFDPTLPPRDGEFMQYVKGAIKSHHISYYANVPHEPARGRANLRKNNQFVLLQSGLEGIPSLSREVHRLRLVKDGGWIRFYVDGRKVIDYLDEGVDHGPVLEGGKIGFRQMKWTHFRYRDFRVWSLVASGCD